MTLPLVKSRYQTVMTRLLRSNAVRSSRISQTIRSYEQSDVKSILDVPLLAPIGVTPTCSHQHVLPCTTDHAYFTDFTGTCDTQHERPEATADAG